jgi:hypothetical protein
MNTNLMGPAKQNDEKINILTKQFFSALDDFKKYYVYFNKNPEVNEFQNYYVNSKSQVQSMTRDLFLLTNSIDKSIENLDSQMQVISLKLEDEKNLNVEFTKLFNDLTNTKDGSDLLINDSKEEYNNQYYYNWEMILGIFIVGFTLTVLFKTKTTQHV